jgi:hypothetical protein
MHINGYVVMMLGVVFTLALSGVLILLLTHRNQDKK